MIENFNVYEPNKLMKFSWHLYSWQDWQIYLFYGFFMALAIYLNVKFIKHFTSKFKIFNILIHAFQFLWGILIIFMGFSFLHLKVYMKPYSNLQKLIWFQTNYPNYHNNKLLNECNDVYRDKLIRTPHLTMMFADEMQICIDAKSKTIYQQSSLEDERKQNILLYQNQDSKFNSKSLPIMDGALQKKTPQLHSKQNGANRVTNNKTIMNKN